MTSKQDIVAQGLDSYINNESSYTFMTSICKVFKLRACQIFSPLCWINLLNHYTHTAIYEYMNPLSHIGEAFKDLNYLLF